MVVIVGVDIVDVVVDVGSAVVCAVERRSELKPMVKPVHRVEVEAHNRRLSIKQKGISILVSAALAPCPVHNEVVADVVANGRSNLVPV